MIERERYRRRIYARKNTDLSGRVLFSISSTNGMKFEDTNVSVNPRAYSQPEENVRPTDNFRWENMHLLNFGHQHMSVTPSAIKEQRISLSHGLVVTAKLCKPMKEKYLSSLRLSDYRHMSISAALSSATTIFQTSNQRLAVN